MLEDSIRKLCDLTNRDFHRYLLLSKSVLASNIGDIFRCTFCDLLSKLRPRALHNCLPFVRDSLFKSFNPRDLDGAMKTAFGNEIFRSFDRCDLQHRIKYGTLALNERAGWRLGRMALDDL